MAFHLVKRDGDGSIAVTIPSFRFCFLLSLFAFGFDRLSRFEGKETQLDRIVALRLRCASASSHSPLVRGVFATVGLKPLLLPV